MSHVSPHKEDQFREALSSLHGQPLAVICQAFNLPPQPGVRLFTHLHLRQAAVVLTLLRTNDQTCRRAAERLSGVTIKRLRSAVPPYPPLPVRHTPRSGDMRRFTFTVKENPNHHLKARQRFDLIRPGKTIEDYLAQGGTRRHLRECLRAGYVRIEA